MLGHHVFSIIFLSTILGDDNHLAQGHVATNLSSSDVIHFAMPNVDNQGENSYLPMEIPRENLKTTTPAIHSVTSDVFFIPGPNKIPDPEIEVKPQMIEKHSENLDSKPIIYEDNKPKDVFMIGREGSDKSQEVNREEELRLEIANAESEQKYCESLVCNRTLNPVCGGRNKMIPHRRLFRNQCFFDLVNCGFNYDSNKYGIVDLQKCSHVATHSINYRPEPTSQNRRHAVISNEALNRMEMFNSRRTNMDTDEFVNARGSLTQTMNGRGCGHECPKSCPDDHVPECGVTYGGKKRVFNNHCLLDMESCNNNEVWTVRPLRVCSKEKVEAIENSKVISWMRNIGLLDNLGRPWQS